MSEGRDRRAFVRSSLAASTALGLAASRGVFADVAAQATEPKKASLPQRALGKTGRQVSIYGLGGLFTVSMHEPIAGLPIFRISSASSAQLHASKFSIATGQSTK